MSIVDFKKRRHGTGHWSGTVEDGRDWPRRAPRTTPLNVSNNNDIAHREETPLKRSALWNLNGCKHTVSQNRTTNSWRFVHTVVVSSPRCFDGHELHALSYIGRKAKSHAFELTKSPTTQLMLKAEDETTTAPCPEKRCHFIFCHNFAKS